MVGTFVSTIFIPLHLEIGGLIFHYQSSPAAGLSFSAGNEASDFNVFIATLS